MCTSTAAAAAVLYMYMRLPSTSSCIHLANTMDVAYDHIQEKALTPAERREAEDAASSSTTTTTTTADSAEQPPPAATLNAEFQQAFQAVSASPWGAKLGGWFSQAKKQSETFYQDLSKEAADASEQATKGLSSLREQVVQRTRGMSDLQISRPGAGPDELPADEEKKEGEHTPDAAGATKEGETEEAPGLSADIVKEAASLVTIFRSTAAQKLKDLQKAEDAADEALVRYGTNLRNFLRDAVTISGPDGEEEGGGEARGKGSHAASEVLFSTEDAGTGKKIFHTTRLDAQLHAIHANAASFAEEPQGVEWESWRAGFDVDSKTENIAADLERYEELRRAMEKLVPEKVVYRDFWMRYYYLRKAVEAEEARRKEVLKGELPNSSRRHVEYLIHPWSKRAHKKMWYVHPGAAADTEEEVRWDDDDDEDEEREEEEDENENENERDQSSTPNANAGANKLAGASTTTLNAPAATSHHPNKDDNALLNPTDATRRSEDGTKSVADSDASYDLVSGATSRAPGSPKEPQPPQPPPPPKKKDEEESDDDDWE
jgi:hypothetical protein